MKDGLMKDGLVGKIMTRFVGIGHKKSIKKKN